MFHAMRKLLVFLLLLALLLVGLFVWLREPVSQTTTAALRAYPVYSFVRTRNETLLRAAHAGANGSNRLFHRSELSGPRDRWITTPNNDTLYSTAFLDLASGPVQLTIPRTEGRYFSVAVMDARTDNNFIIRDPGDGGTVTIEFGDGEVGERPPSGDGFRRYAVSTKEAWLLIRVLVDGVADLEAARAAQQGFVLAVPEGSARPARTAAVLPVLPDPAMLLRRTSPLVAENAHLQDAALASTGYGGGAEVFEELPVWRQWLWRLLLPKIFEKMKAEIAEGSRRTGDGWSKSPPGIGAAEASDGVRAAVALAGLGALPTSEAVYWSATQDSGGKDLEGGRSYRLTIPADVPVGSFWSLSMYERLADGRLFYIENPIGRYAVGNRTRGLLRNPDGSLTLTMAATDPGDGHNWLPAPAGGAFALVFRAYRPGEAILSGTWRLPAVEEVKPS